MQKWTKIAISVPLLVMPLAFGSNGANAQEKSFGPLGAVQLLAQSKAADGKCKYLSAKGHMELGDYLAKAEVSAAASNTAGEAQAARRKGAKAGKAMACNEKSRELVAATMDAARRAMAAAIAQRRQRSQTRKIVRTPQKRLKQVRPNGPVVAVIAKPSTSRSLTRYRRITEAYYLERRCQHLSRANAMRFWKKVVASHNAVLKKYTISQVAKAKNGAKQAATHWGACGTRTARIVNAGYRG